MIQPLIHVWKTQLSQPTSTSPIVVGNHLLFATKPSSPMNPHSDLIALNLEDGQVAWQHHFEYALISGQQAYRLLSENQTIGIVSTQSGDLLHGHGSVMAFDEAGDIVWQWQGEEKSYGAPAAQEMQLLTMAGTNTLAVVNPEGEGNKSVTRIDLAVISSTAAPALCDNIAYIPCRTPDLFAINLTSSEQWHFHAPDHERNWLDQTPVWAGNTLFTVGRMGILYALDRNTLKLQWQQKIGEKRPLSQPAVDENQVYVGFRYGLTVLDKKNGQTIWTFDTKRAVSAQPFILGNVIYMCCEDHHLYALDKTSGEELWRLEMARRINIPPILTPSCMVVVDRGGNVLALELPELPEGGIHQESRSVQVRKETLAQRLSERGEYAKASELWLDLGNLEKAAGTYEQAEAWQEAADLWRQLDRDGKRADALEKYAKSLVGVEPDEEEIAAAWERAARAHAELGQRTARQRCEHEVARHRQLPLLEIDIEDKDLTLNQWSNLDFVVKNIGFGPARQVNVTLIENRFVGRAKQTTTWVTVMPTKSFANWIEVQPQAQGEEVPMRLLVEYNDRTGNVKTLERTFYVSVAGEQEAPTGSREFAQLELPDGRDHISFRRNLIEFFNADELDTLLFDLGARPDDFSEHLSVKAREIITWAAQRNKIDALVDYCQRERPDVNW